MSFFIQCKTLQRLSDLLKKKQCKTERLLKKKKKKATNQLSKQMKGDLFFKCNQPPMSTHIQYLYFIHISNVSLSTCKNVCIKCGRICAATLIFSCLFFYKIKKERNMASVIALDIGINLNLKCIYFFSRG